MGDGGGYRAGFQAVALNVADADVVGVLMPLYHGDLQHIIFHIDAVGVPGVHRGDLAVHHADDAPGTLLGKVLSGEGRYMEGLVGPLHQIRLDLRGREILDLTVIHHENALLVDLLDVEVLEIVDDDEVCQIAGGNAAPVVQQEVPGGVVAGHLDRGDGVGPQRDGLLHDIVDVALFQQVIGMLIVCAEHAAVGVLAGEQGHQRL